MQLHRVQLRVDKDQKIFVLLHISLPADWSKRCVTLRRSAEGMDLPTRKWITEETCSLIFFVY